MGAKSERRGTAFGNARGVPDKQVRVRRNRENDPRYQAAMAEVRENQAMIDRLAAQTAGEAQTAAEARSKVSLTYVKPEVIVPEPTVEPLPTPKATDHAGRRFADCHCGHTKGWHEGNVAPQCGNAACDCVGYRPSTAPDPLSPTASAVTKIELLIQSGKESSQLKTRHLAEKVELMLVQLRERVDFEDEEREARAAAERKAREARERVQRLERELAEARGELATVTKRPRPTKAKPPKPTGANAQGKFVCPTCGEGFNAAQGRGAHRAKKHGYRKGDDDK